MGAQRQRRGGIKEKSTHRKSDESALGTYVEVGKALHSAYCRPRVYGSTSGSPATRVAHRESPGSQCFFGLAASAHMHLHKGDVTAAFLQGDDTELERGGLAEPVQELAKTLKLQPWERGRLRKAVYGLVNAPRAWWAKVNQVVAHLGWIASSLEPSLSLEALV